MDEVLSSSTALFCSPCSGANVAKHYNILQLLMQKRGTFELDDKNIVAEEYKKTTENISEQQPQIADDQDIIIIPTQVNFANYKAIVSFVNTENVHWKFLYLLRIP
ncbi:hypothetical protein ROHU_001767 [Labeo rohita]|uniref:Uncharacterized protein n=1 Tax=Labeo rohita TaxID=84645 RepID=A0A498NZN5_LABRO|nr:hypothetical protein ROHU_001767 [Labeo rohita]